MSNAIQQLPDNVCSRNDERSLTKTMSKNTVDAVGVYIINSLKILLATVGAAFTIMLEIQISGQVGRYYFEPIPNEANSTLFGTSTVLAATLLTVVTLHLASMGKEKSALLKVIDKWAPRCAFLFIIGLALLLFTTMSGDLATGDLGGWESSIPLVQEWIGWLQSNVFEPISKLAFAIGFACIVILSAFSLSKFLEWWLDAAQKILEKVAFSRFRKEAAQNLKHSKSEYRRLSASVNAELARKDSDHETAFALMVYQVCTRIIKETRAHLNKDSSQFDSYRTAGSDTANLEALKQFEKDCSFDYLLAAVKGEVAPPTVSHSSHNPSEVH